METRTCSKCKQTKFVREFTPRPNRPVGWYSRCHSCKATSRKQRYHERRIENPTQQWSVLASNWTKDRAKKSGVVYALSSEYLQKELEESLNRCRYCACELNFQATIKDRHRGPSVDRIEPSLGYIQSNVVVCCYRCNRIKNDATPDELIRLAEAVSRVKTQKLSSNHL